MSGVIQTLFAVTLIGPPPPDLTATATGTGWFQIEPGNPYLFWAGVSVSGGSGDYSYLWSDGVTSGPSYSASWNEAEPPQIDIYCTVTDNITMGMADSNTVSSTPP